MKKLDKKNIIRIIAFSIFIVVSIVATILIIPFITSLSTESGRLIIKEKVESFGPFGWVIFLALQILQVIIAMIPGEPIEIIAGILFGTIGGFVLCIIGLLIGSICVFYLVKAVGKPIVNAFVSEEKLNSLKLINTEKKLEMLIFVLFLIPGTPKDALTYFVPLTKIKPSRFFIVSTVARMPAVISSTIIGTNIGSGNWIWAIVITVITGAVGLLGITLHDKFFQHLKEKHNKPN